MRTREDTTLVMDGRQKRGRGGGGHDGCVPQLLLWRTVFLTPCLCDG